MMHGQKTIKLKNLFVYETTWKNTVEPAGPQDDNMAHALCTLGI
jgi:hypothetical protein